MLIGIQKLYCSFYLIPFRNQLLHIQRRSFYILHIHTSKMGLFAKIINGLKPLAIFTKELHVRLFIGSNYACDIIMICNNIQVNTFNPGQSIWNRIERSSETGHGKKSLISTFACFWLLLPMFNFWGGAWAPTQI